jgi:hypothetical protein
MAAKKKKVTAKPTPVHRDDFSKEIDEVLNLVEGDIGSPKVMKRTEYISFLKELISRLEEARDGSQEEDAEDKRLGVREDMSKNTFEILKSVVERATCKPGWTFNLDDDDEGFRLVIFVPVTDAREGELTGVRHYFPVPTTTWNEKSWRRWVFERCRKVEDHELAEWFLVGGERPFAPLHGPGHDPYTIREVSTEEEARTDQQGNPSL